MFRFLRDPSSMLLSIPGIILAITFHEIAHGYAAESMGDSTAREAGRLSLNPLAHLSLWGTLSMIFLGFGWAKPVPINPAKFRDRRKGIILVSLSGCIANFVLGFLSLTVWYVVVRFVPGNDVLNQILYYIYLYNIVFGVFNLIPIPPLDGSQILYEFLPYNMHRYYDILAQHSFIILFLLIGLGVVGMVINPIVNLVNTLYMSVLNFIFGLF